MNNNSLKEARFKCKDVPVNKNIAAHILSSVASDIREVACYKSIEHMFQATDCAEQMWIIC